ncbi:MAG: single-stranded-DNA-specific exonuclease RecJ [Ignavibacteria bacterium]|nr:single-stranded-DNA-specific exonuclease RecJ [Ignavibacteria bacterium]MCC7159371.1 single-stranded-DNA-specific exonuclease RecJ [Ignavibacteria bacterium]
MSSAIKKKWTISCVSDEKKVKHLSEEINVPSSLASILVNRGIHLRTDAKKFFVHDLKNLYDPFRMLGMEKASNRIVDVINNKEKILIFGDYDVDGTSGVSMFHTFLRELDIPNEVFIPDRFTDGYGLSNTGIDVANKLGIKLIVAIDCGITAVDKVAYAKNLGIDFIICDHHQPPEELPDAYAILDALQQDCQYPFKSLCGTGVAFKLIQAVCQKLNLDSWYNLLDFVAVATAADMVPVIDENRTLISFGFKQILSNPRPSFATIFKNSNLKLEHVTTSNVVFTIGPRINAVGRLGDATRAVKFLTSKTTSEAEELMSVLEKENTNRKKIDSEIYLQAQTSYETARSISIGSDSADDVAIVLHNPDWHPGVLGIIASRMVEKYYRPSIILTTFNGYAKGSARSINNFNIYDAIKQTSEECNAVVQFGGHYHAAGIEIEIEKIEEFRNTFNRIAKSIIRGTENGDEMLVPEIKVDAEIDVIEVNQRFVKILSHFEPFGPGNMTPVFLTRNLQIVGEPKTYNGSTTVFKVRKPVSNDSRFDNYTFDCVYYQPPDLDNNNRHILRSGNRLDIIYSVEENHWNGNTKTQFRIRDLKLN